MISVSALLNRIATEILNPLIVLLFGMALILFLWGGFKFIRDADSEEGRTLGKQSLVWGLVGMVIMVSVYAILRIAAGTFGVDLPSY